MARIDDIKTEISTDPVKGLNSYQAGYLSTNSVQVNLDLIHFVDPSVPTGVQQYRDRVGVEEIIHGFDPDELIGLGAADRSDFDVFVRGLFLNSETVLKPYDKLMALVNTIFSGVSGTITRPAIDALTKEYVSPATFLNLGQVHYSEMEEAMLQLGWI